jgi:hypothetical protein
LPQRSAEEENSFNFKMCLLSCGETSGRKLASTCLLYDVIQTSHQTQNKSEMKIAAAQLSIKI